MLFYIIDGQSSTTTAIVLFRLVCEMAMMMLLGSPPHPTTPLPTPGVKWPLANLPIRVSFSLEAIGAYSQRA